MMDSELVHWRVRLISHHHGSSSDVPGFPPVDTIFEGGKLKLRLSKDSGPREQDLS